MSPFRCIVGRTTDGNLGLTFGVKPVPTDLWRLKSGDPNGIDFGPGPAPFGLSPCDCLSRFARLELKFSSR
jgi:hypothetical protein